MRITAAVLYDVNKPYSIETVELDPPRRGEVLVKVGAAGVCRSDLHFQKGEATIALPAVLGHEGSGTVEAVGEGVSMVKPGDRVILSFVPNCGHCHSCESGHPHLCDEHARTTGKLFDGTSRLHTQSGQDCTHMGKVACFAEYAVVPEVGCILAPLRRIQLDRLDRVGLVDVVEHGGGDAHVLSPLTCASAWLAPGVIGPAARQA